jgi:hypothetical protein
VAVYITPIPVLAGTVPYGRREAGGMDHMEDIARWLVNDAPHMSS